MSAPNKFSYVPKTSTMKSVTPPQYARVTASLSDPELDEELDSERGRTDPEWHDALQAEKQRRGRS